MPITLGNTTITGLAAGGLPSNSVTSDTIGSISSTVVNTAIKTSNYAGLPSSYVALINSRDPSHIYWCATAANGGSDSNSGTFASPWLNPYYAVKQIPTGVRATLILKAGTYSYTDQACVLTGQGSSRRGIVISDGYTNANTNTPVTTRNLLIVGYPGQTILSATSVTSGQPGDDWRDFGMIGLFNPQSIALGLIIKRNNGGRVNNYSVAMWGPDVGAAYAGTAQNCVFQELNANGNCSNSYNNSNNNYYNFNYCTTIASNFLSNYSGGTSGSSCSIWSNSWGDGLDFSGSAQNVTVNTTTFRVTSGTQKTGYGGTAYNAGEPEHGAGVYGGSFGWGQL